MLSYNQPEILAYGDDFGVTRRTRVKVEMADAWSSKLNGYYKRRKNRLERRRAKLIPDCFPTYGKYIGYLS